MRPTVSDCDKSRRPAPRRTMTSQAAAELLVEVETRFDEAGMTLARLPGGWRSRIALQEMLDELPYDEEAPPIARPTPLEIDRMDECFTWLAHLPLAPAPDRWLVKRRLLRNGRTGAYYASWSQLGRQLGVSNHTATAWHARAMRAVAIKLRHG